ncbi:hypothetical protein BRPE64_ECDS01230 (plasmid) [Caballeronia insecticola]|uniref:Uncharacterized protein n=1 Tax=Caballeronia insecticola TaxID=758793 RepID=A0A060PRB4_9BURK|nr:hypothetical protein BRPE64_ECDS01230 [Caballeronia insecticola]
MPDTRTLQIFGGRHLRSSDLGPWNRCMPRRVSERMHRMDCMLVYTRFAI